MNLPVRDIVYPAKLIGQANGQLDESLLEDIEGGRLVGPAAKAWTAMVAAAKADGITLEPADSYRNLLTQMSIFADRYTLEPIAGQPSVVWLERTYWQRPGTALAAVPGFSNHGWGLAVDVRYVDAAGRMMWLSYNAERFGWSWEVQSENWHIHFFGGDDFQLPAPPPEEPDMTLQELAQAFGPKAVLGADGVIRIPLATDAAIRDPAHAGETEMFPVGDVWAYTHQETKTARLKAQSS